MSENSLPFVLCFLCSVLGIFLTPDTRHLKPFRVTLGLEILQPAYILITFTTIIDFIAIEDS